MPTPVKMPRLGESVAEGTIGSWLKQEGDWIERDESLAEIITDKITAELPSPIEGRLSKILIQADETVPVGTDIALIEEGVEAQAEPAYAAAPAAQAQKTEPHFAAAGNTGRNGVAGRARPEEERLRISPLARRLAREHALDLNVIPGSGAGGRVRKDDILAYVAQHPHASVAIPQAPAAEKPQPLPEPTVSYVPGEDEEVITPSRMRLAIAEHMVRSKRTSPHATTMVEVDMTSIARWLAKYKEDFKKQNGYGMSFVPFVMKAVCEGIHKVPLINSTWTPDNQIVVKKHINLGLAVATDLGLVVPTLYAADQYTLAGLARQIATLAQRARANKLTLQDMQNSTFVVNNPGTFGTIISVPIINQPHAGILSMDAVVKRAVVVEDDAIAVRSMMFLCLSFDHRILDGAGAGSFLQVVRTKLESYGREIDVY